MNIHQRSSLDELHLTGAGLTVQQSDVLEQVQRQVLRVLLPDFSYSEARHISGLPTLSERRTKLCLNFASGLARSTEFNHWLSIYMYGFRKHRPDINMTNNYAASSRFH